MARNVRTTAIHVSLSFRIGLYIKIRMLLQKRFQLIVEFLGLV